MLLKTRVIMRRKMEAKDTVSLKKLDNIYNAWLKKEATAGDLQLDTAYAQAEISFPAGVEEGWEQAEAHYRIDTG